MPAKNNIMWQVKVNQNTSYAFNIVIFYSTSAVAVTLRLCVDILHSRGRLTSHIFSLPNTRWVWSKSDERAITVLCNTTDDVDVTAQEILMTMPDCIGLPGT